MSNLNPFTMAQQQLDTAAKKLGLDKALHDLLRWPMKEIKVILPVKMDDGSTKVFHGFRVQYNTSRGPAKGGIRWHPDETIDTVRALSAWMTWKTSVVDLPLGGGKGGIICNPKELSETEKERLARAFVREAAKKLNIDLKGKTMAVQGFGNAGQFAATLGKELLGLKLIAASDSKGGVFNKNGIDPDALVKYKLQTDTLQGFPGTEPISNEDLLTCDCTVLFPSALEQVITDKNAGRIKCKIMCELANGPTTPEADEILYKNGVFVLPDFLANAGGVTVSYFEQVQNTYNYYWELDEVYSKLDVKMTKAFNAVYDMYVKEKVNMRQAAYLVSVARVAEACKLRGWV
ncbi:MAG: Glu/Leu/Phe/Val dehydrogenase [Spirochaetes bacterium]|nr:Glu/Leu/Phe/Val dehydrogenase [Spirochaetota bacterium]